MNASLNTGLFLFGALLFGMGLSHFVHVKALFSALFGFDSIMSTSEQVLVILLIIVVMGYVVSLI